MAAHHPVFPRMEGMRLSSQSLLPLLLLLVLLLYSLSAATVSAKEYDVGDKPGWAPGVNYTEWAARHRFFVGDWLVFYYQRGNIFDVTWVNETAYNSCSAEGARSSYGRGRNWVIQLNETGWYYFICSKGFCYNGMKLAVFVEPLPAPVPAPVQLPSAAAASAISSAALISGFFAVAALLPELKGWHF